MKRRVTLDVITFDPRSDEYVLYLVEDGPWPESSDGWHECLLRIQGRVYDVVDVVIDGELAARFPDSIGKRVRIEIDSPSGEPEQLRRLISDLKSFFDHDPEYRHAIENSEFTIGLHIVTGTELGRFR